MRSIVVALLSALFWVLMFIIAAFMYLVAVVVWATTAPFDRRKVVLHAFTNFWASLFTWLNPVWTVQVRGREHLEPGRVYVMVANHLSVVDIFVMHRLWRHFKWLSKIENFSLPFVGWNMRLNEYVPVRRGERASVLEMFERSRQTLAKGSSLVIFPEGTRGTPEVMKPWKPGAFELAKETDTAVLPIAIQGTAKAMAIRKLRIGPARMRMTLLPAIEVDEVRRRSVEELRDHARDTVWAFMQANPWPPPRG